MKAHIKKPPKVVAIIKICGCIQYKVTENHNFIKPTPEQIENLHNLLNIDVVLIDDETKEEEVPEAVTEGEEKSEEVAE